MDCQVSEILGTVLVEDQRVGRESPSAAVDPCEKERRKEGDEGKEEAQPKVQLPESLGQPTGEPQREGCPISPGVLCWTKEPGSRTLAHPRH